MNSPVSTQQHSERRLLVFICIALALLQVLDLHSSLRAVEVGRSETNPLILWLIGHIGFGPAVCVFKVIALVIVGAYYRVVSGFRRMLWPAISLVPVCAAYVAVVLNNYS